MTVPVKRKVREEKKLIDEGADCRSYAKQKHKHKKISFNEQKIKYPLAHIHRRQIIFQFSHTFTNCNWDVLSRAT